mmetsp:Transcript_254/g.582  ORF Transcript_254/g.582 Transcript_254/m.582 type:complete len:219 (-) Transcript_254:58-714(-)
MSTAAAAATTVVLSRITSADRPPRAALSEADRKRKAASERRRKLCKEIFEKYDTQKSGKLNRDQMMQLLTDISTSAPQGVPPTQEELDFVMQSSDVAGTFLGGSDGEIDASELRSAVAYWVTYVDNRPFLEESFAKFDTNQSGKLDQMELKNYLVSLNGGLDVTDKEVAWVFKMADLSKDGQLSKQELMKATLHWYVYVNDGRSSQDSLQPDKCCLVL